MKRLVVSGGVSRLAGVVAFVAVLAGCQTAAPPAEQSAAAPAADPVERGRYLVTTGNCGDCHTPWAMGPNGPAPDATRLLSGHPADVVLPATALPEGWGMLVAHTNTAFLGPWGISYSTNLTSDPSGLGNVTEDMFITAMRTGKHFGTGRPILPPMPWHGVGTGTDEDLKAMYAYLRSIPPISNAVPDPTPPPAPTP